MSTERHPAQAAARPDWPRRPNIVFVLTDDQGYGEVAAHGNPVIQTPTLDRLYHDAVRFERFHVSPTCAPTRSALMTGRHEFRNRISHTILGRSLIDADLYVLPDLLREAGYRTGMFGKWHLGDNYPCRPQDLGFDEARHHGGGGICQTPDYWGNSYFSPTLDHLGQWEPSDGYCTDVFFQAGLRWIESVKDDGPFYAYLATNCPHRPLQVPRRYSDRYLESEIDRHAQRYYGMITNVDENLGRLLQQLEDWGILDDTLVIFMGDNGSLALGGALAGLAILTRTELLLIILGGLFVLETVSVMLQVSTFKVTKRLTGTGRRLFRIAPIHHHFEMLGWEQVTVTIRFWIITGICVAVGLGVFYAEWVAGIG